MDLARRRTHATSGQWPVAGRISPALRWRWLSARRTAPGGVNQGYLDLYADPGDPDLYAYPEPPRPGDRRSGDRQPAELWGDAPVVAGVDAMTEALALTRRLWELAQSGTPEEREYIAWRATQTTNDLVHLVRSGGPLPPGPVWNDAA